MTKKFSNNFLGVPEEEIIDTSLTRIKISAKTRIKISAKIKQNIKKIGVEILSKYQ